MTLTEKIKLALISLAVGFGVTGIVLAVFSLIISLTLPDENLYSGFSLVAFSLGSMVCGYVFVSKTCKKGLLSGIALGLVFFAVISVAGIILYKSQISFSTVFRLICGILSGGIGGVIAINRCSADRKIN